MESASVTEFFSILNLLPFWVKALPLAFLAALVGRVIGNGDDEEDDQKKSAAYNVVTVLASMAIGILAGGFAHDEKKVGQYASLAIAMILGIGGVYIVIGVKNLFKGFSKRPESTLKKYWPFKWNPWENGKNNTDEP